MKLVRMSLGVGDENKRKVAEWTNSRNAEFLLQWSGPKWSFPLTVEQMQEDGMYSIIYDDAFAGMMQIMCKENGNVHIGRIIVNPELTGQGIGTLALKRFTEIIAKEIGFSSVTLCVYAYNKPAIKCYQKNGFSVIEKIHYEGQQARYKMIYDNPIMLDMKAYKRLDHFQYFRSLAFPYVGITSDVDITDFYNLIHKNGYPFFLSFLWCVSRAANGVKEFRQRIEEDKIIEYPFCRTSHTVAKPDETYAYCTLDERMRFSDFLEYAGEKQEEVKNAGTIDENEEEAKSFLFISTVPWITYSSLIQPMSIPADSNPRITWGKFYDRDGHKFMPVSVLCHHALVDGKHIARFHELLEQEMRGLT